MAHGNGPLRTRIPPWADALVHLLDRAFVIPGTKIRVGLDPILGFFAPGAGDAASAVATTALLWLAFSVRVPKVILFRMLLNIAIDAVIGAVPLVGDLFDVAFRAGEKNLELIRKYGQNPDKKPELSDYVVLVVCGVCVLALLSLPVITGLLLMHGFAELWGNSPGR